MIFSKEEEVISTSIVLTVINQEVLYQQVSYWILDWKPNFLKTGIYERRGQIEDRVQSTTPTYLMPQIGRSLVNAEGVAMLLEYLEAIEE